MLPMWKCHRAQSNPLCLSPPSRTLPCVLFPWLVLPRASVDRNPRSSRTVLKHFVTPAARQTSAQLSLTVCNLRMFDHRGFACRIKEPEIQKVWICWVSIVLRRLLGSNPRFWWPAYFTSPQHERASVCFSSSRYSCMFMCRGGDTPSLRSSCFSGLWSSEPSFPLAPPPLPHSAVLNRAWEQQARKFSYKKVIVMSYITGR